MGNQRNPLVFYLGLLFKKRLILPLTTSLLLLLSSVTFSQPAVSLKTPVVNAAVVEASTTDTIAEASSTALIAPIAPMDVESYVRAYYAKTPVLAKIAYCESRFRQFTPDGDVMRGRVVHSDVGVMQINEYYHMDEAAKLGFNLHTLDGNLGFAQYLYNREGTQPWSASAPCWDK